MKLEKDNNESKVIPLLTDKSELVLSEIQVNFLPLYIYLWGWGNTQNAIYKFITL